MLGGFATQDNLLLPLFSSWGAIDFLPEEHRDDNTERPHSSLSSCNKSQSQNEYIPQIMHHWFSLNMEMIQSMYAYSPNSLVLNKTNRSPSLDMGGCTCDINAYRCLSESGLRLQMQAIGWIPDIDDDVVMM